MNDAKGKAWVTYMLRCCDGSLYTGCTNDLTHRLQVHNKRYQGSKYVWSRRPFTCVYVEAWESGRAAQQREYAIKRMTKAQKEALVGHKNLEEKTDATDNSA